MTPPLIKVLNLSKKFGQDEILKNLSFSVKKGEFLAIIGPLGCGKTTLLKVLAGLEKPNSGQVFFQEHEFHILADQGRSVILEGAKRPIGSLERFYRFISFRSRMTGDCETRDEKCLASPAPKIALVFQKSNLLPWFNVYNNIALPLKIIKINKQEIKKRVSSVLNLTGMKKYQDSLPDQLSGGQEQLVALARAFCMGSKLLLLDEPFAHLDALRREALNWKLAEIWQGQKKTIIMVTHQINEAVFLADRVIVLTDKPARIKKEFEITFPRPRGKNLLAKKEFVLLCQKIRNKLEF